MFYNPWQKKKKQTPLVINLHYSEKSRISKNGLPIESVHIIVNTLKILFEKWLKFLSRIKTSNMRTMYNNK